MNPNHTFIQYLQQQKVDCTQRERELVLDDRKDEATLCRIERNIYDIFLTVYQAAVRDVQKKQGDINDVNQFFLDRTKLIPSTWERSYEAAKQHNDASKILIEEVKLRAVRKIITEFKQQEGLS